MKQVKDFYYKKAKQTGVAARSFFKLEEIDRKHGVFKKGMTVLDLGCAPGSWMQYAAKQVGAKGSVYGIDLKPADEGMPANVECKVADIFELDVGEWIKEPLDVVMSDMAPKTTGIKSADAQKSYHLCEQALKLARSYLKPGGHLIVKSFQGEPFQKLRSMFRDEYQSVHICKPKSSRQESVEVFLVGYHKK